MFRLFDNDRDIEKVSSLVHILNTEVYDGDFQFVLYDKY